MYSSMMTPVCTERRTGPGSRPPKFLKKPTILGMISGMIAGLVAITPGAGYVNAYAAFAIGIGAESFRGFR